MDFIDNQAEESEGDDSSVASGSGGDEPKIKKRKMKEKSKKKKKQIESSDDEDDDDDDDEGREEMRDFIADEEEEVPGDAASEKSDQKSGDSELDDDDLDLLDENLDIQKTRQPKRVGIEDSDEEDDQSRIRRDLFRGDDDDEKSERGSEKGGQRSRSRARFSGDEYSDSEHSEDNFIEDDGDGPRRRRKRHRMANVPEGAEDDARDVFGVEDFNFDEFYDDDEAEEMEDEEEIIEDDGEGGEVRYRRKKDGTKKSTLLEMMEPTELEKGFLSAADKKIMMEDLPERFLTRRTPVTECDEEELEKEAQWIYKYGFEMQSVSNQSSSMDYDQLECHANIDEMDRDQKKDEVVTAIREVLRYIRVKSNSFEIPFIMTYRKEIVDQLLNVNNVWKVYDYDEKWCHLMERKNKLLELNRRMRYYQENGDDVLAARRPISEMDLIDINYAETMEQLTDFHANFQLLYGASLESMVQWEKNRKLEEGDEEEYKARFKASIRNDKYQMCVENGIGELAGRFGLTAKQFAENLDWKKHEVEQDEEMPLDAADAYICSAFPTKEMVLNGAKFMLAKEISRQPLVRERVRREYRSSARIWVRPTKKGRDTLDDAHPMYEKRYIREKPVKELQDEDFLYYHKMKEEGLIELVLDCDTEDDRLARNSLADKILVDQPFHKDEYTELVEEWNTIRAECARMAIDEMLLPYMKGELHNFLLEEAKEAVAKKCRKEFEEKIAYAGYVPPKNDDDDEDDEDELDQHGSIRIMAIAYTSARDEAAFGVMVDENGMVVDYLRMVHFMKRTNGHGHTGALKAESMDLFKKFVQRRRPHAIGLNIEDMECQRLKRDLDEAIDDLYGNRLIVKRPPIFLLDNEAAKVYMKSNASIAEHPDYPPILRQAVSLARILLDPLPEFTHLWNSDEDIFCLSLHPLQHDIDPERLSSIMMHELMNRINHVGVDINKCLEFPHYANMLQFVNGLGPRKVAALTQVIKVENENLIESRTKLVTVCKLGPKVFMNCAAFIRIDTEKVSERTEAYVEVLDGSRVHPETYEWARKMAVDALEVDESADPTTALMEIMESPQRLRDLDLDAFADELRRQGFGEKKSTLYDIVNELSARFQDMRPPYSDPSEERLFDLLSRSGKEIREGQKVLGTVHQVQYKRIDRSEGNDPLPETDNSGMFSCPYCKEYTADDPGSIQEHMSKDDRSGGCPGTPTGIRVRLDNGMIGFCPNKNISKDHVDNPLTRVKLNRPYWFRVIRVNKEKFSYLLSCKSSDLKENSEHTDAYWDEEMYQMDQDEAASELMRKKEASTRVKRVIQHPSFHNISYEAATKMLDSLDWSECIIRPSANKDSSLSVTWKISNRVYHNFFVEEGAKDQVFSIAKQLRVGNEEFEDLNELIARFVQPMIQISHEITTHKYFCEDATCEELKTVEAFVAMKKRELGRNTYVFSASLKRPCQFCLSYMFDNSGRIRHEYFMIHPRGLRFRHQNFDSLDMMMSWFKRHFNERPIDQMRSRHHGNPPPNHQHHPHPHPPAVRHHPRPPPVHNFPPPPPAQFHHHNMPNMPPPPPAHYL